MPNRGTGCIGATFRAVTMDWSSATNTASNPAPTSNERNMFLTFMLTLHRSGRRLDNPPPFRSRSRNALNPDTEYLFIEVSNAVADTTRPALPRPPPSQQRTFRTLPVFADPGRPLTINAVYIADCRRTDGRTGVSFRVADDTPNGPSKRSASQRMYPELMPVGLRGVHGPAPPSEPKSRPLY